MRSSLLGLAAVMLAASFLYLAGGLAEMPAAGNGEAIELSYAFEAPVVASAGAYVSVSVEGLDNYGNAGEPSLPSKPIRILIPYGMEVAAIETDGTWHSVEGAHTVEPVQAPASASYTPGRARPNASIYSSAMPFPEAPYVALPVQRSRGYSILPLRLYPVRFIPSKKALEYAQTLHVRIVLAPSDEQLAGTAQNADDEAAVAAAVENAADVRTYDGAWLAGGTLSIPAVPADYVIITNASYNATFWDLADWKRTRPERRLNASVVLVENITADADYWCDGMHGDGCGSGSQYNDTQAMVRNFIKDAYTNWGTRYVLLGGDDEVIPHRGVYGYVSPYMDTDIPCDMYYGTLDGNWNADNDSRWGESGEADLLAEVYVGRAPASNVTEAANFVAKTIAYENATFNNASYLSKAAFLGAIADAYTEGANIKDEITDLAPQLETTKFYNRDGTYNTTAILETMNAGTHIVNYVGHSSQTIFSSNDGQYITSAHASALTNNETFLAYSQGCHAASFDYDDSVAERFVNGPSGAFAFIGNSRYGWYYQGRSDGPSDEFDKTFFNAFMNGTTSMGAALAESKERLSAYMTMGVYRWVAFELNLLGDPETRLKVNFTTPTADFSANSTYLTTSPFFRGIAQLNGTATAGSASGASFQNYSIEWGGGVSPTQWSSAGVSLAGNGLSQTEGILGTFNTNYAPEDRLTMRLIVNGSSGSSEDRMVFWNVNYAENRNVSECMDLYGDNSNYTLASDVSSSGTCFTIKGSNIHVDCDGHAINYSTASTGYGVLIELGGGSVTGCAITEGGNAGSSYGIYYGWAASGASASNNTIRTYSMDSYGVYIDGGSFNLTDCHVNASASGTADLYVKQGHLQTANVTFEDNEIAHASSSITVRWHLDARVNATAGSISGANVTAANAAGAQAFSQLTGSDGMIQRQSMAEYNLSGVTGFVMKTEDAGKSYFTNYTVAVTKAGYNSVNSTLNLTGNTALAFTLSSGDTGGPTVEIYAPQNTTYGSATVALNYTATDLTGVDACWRSSDGRANVTLPLCANATLTGLADGAHSAVVFANDTGGNVSSASVLFTVDTTGPSIVVASPLNATYGAMVHFNVSTGENSSWCGLSLDGGALAGLNSTNATQWSGLNSSMADGSHEASFWCNDSVGNGNAATANFTSDTVAPNVTFTLSPSSVYIGTSITASCAAADNHKGVFSGVVTGLDTSYAGTRTATCTATDDGGNTAIATASYTVNDIPALGGGGGGGGAAAATATDTKTIVIDNVAANVPKELSMGGDVPAMDSIAFTLGSPAQGVEITVKSLTEKPAGAAAYTGLAQVYRYAEMTFSAGAAQVRWANITFSVNTSWMERNDINETTVALHRLSGGAWAKLTTSMVSKDASSVTYRAESPGFSYFMIAGERMQPLPLGCQEGERRCNGSALLSCAGGTWAQHECLSGCNATECVASAAECRPGEKRCIASAVQECSPSGVWNEKAVCDEGCNGQECMKPTNYTLFFVDISIGMVAVIFTAAYIIKKRYD